MIDNITAPQTSNINTAPSDSSNNSILGSITPLAQYRGPKISQGSFGTVYQDMRNPNQQVIKVTMDDVSQLSHPTCNIEVLRNNTMKIQDLQRNNPDFLKGTVKILEITPLVTQNDKIMYETVMEKLDSEIESKNNLRDNIQTIHDMTGVALNLMSKNLAIGDFKPSNLMYKGEILKIIDVESVCPRNFMSFIQTYFGNSTIDDDFEKDSSTNLNAHKTMALKLAAIANRYLSSAEDHLQSATEIQMNSDIKSSLKALSDTIYDNENLYRTTKIAIEELNTKTASYLQTLAP